MPKNRKIYKKDNRIIIKNVASKLRIGTRKNGVSAMLMSITALKEVLGNPDKKRYHSKARNALQLRDVAAEVESGNSLKCVRNRYFVTVNT